MATEGVIDLERRAPAPPNPVKRAGRVARGGRRSTTFYSPDSVTDVITGFESYQAQPQFEVE
jgi:hypothetical protein